MLWTGKVMNISRRESVFGETKHRENGLHNKSSCRSMHLVSPKTDPYD